MLHAVFDTEGIYDVFMDYDFIGKLSSWTGLEVSSAPSCFQLHTIASSITDTPATHVPNVPLVPGISAYVPMTSPK